MRKTLLKFLTAVLGFNMVSSCFYLYASPHADFEAKGRVSDGDGNPVPGIMVDLANKFYNDQSGELTYEPMDNEKTATSSDGSFYVRATDYQAMPDSVTVLFTDVDGESNGGEFLPKEVTVPVVKVSDGDGAWDVGVYSVPDDMNVILEKAPEVKK